ncbi:MAG TPA: YigZ family protein [Candidatus Bipolaricaulota bacterium]
MTARCEGITLESMLADEGAISTGYCTLARAAEVQLKRADSRFIALAQPLSELSQVERYLDQARSRFPDATHHCSAYRLLHEDSILEHGDDDGEPLHTAGAPMLQVLRGRELCNALVVVVRYFGGTKLGVGGLIRAYGDAAKAALEAAGTVRKIPQARLRIRYSHALTGAVMGVLHRARAQIEGVEHGELAQVRIVLARAQLEELKRQLKEACAGRVEVFDD